MNDSTMKCVMVIDSELPIGIVANTSMRSKVSNRSYEM